MIINSTKNIKNINQSVSMKENNFSSLTDINVTLGMTQLLQKILGSFHTKDGFRSDFVDIKHY